MSIKKTITLKLDRENITGYYTEGENALTLSDGDAVAIEVGDDLDAVIAFLQRVRDMQEPAPDVAGQSKKDVIGAAARRWFAADHSGPSGTACDTLPVGNQRDYGDERPDDDGFITVHP
jgi:hypothetical protein